MPPLDTTSKIQQKHNLLWQGVSPEERFVRGLRFIRASHQMLLAGFRTRYPELSEKELRKKILQQIYHITS